MRRAWSQHPNLLSWAALALGMVIIVFFAARNVGFGAGQWAAIIAATILLAGLCVWIVSWEDAASADADAETPDDATPRPELDAKDHVISADVKAAEAAASRKS